MIDFGASRPIGVLFCAASPQPAVLLCAAHTRTACGLFGFPVIDWFLKGMLRKETYTKTKGRQSNGTADIVNTFPDMHYMKRIYKKKQNKLPSACQQEKEGFLSR